MSRTLGAFGESWAIGHLTRLGYRIVDRNVRFRTGELDIVAWEGDELVFVEVKCRQSRRFGLPAQSVTRSKYTRLAAAIGEYLSERNLEPASYRIDVMAIVIDRDGRVADHELLRAVEAPP